MESYVVNYKSVDLQFVDHELVAWQLGLTDFQFFAFQEIFLADQLLFVPLSSHFQRNRCVFAVDVKCKRSRVFVQHHRCDGWLTRVVAQFGTNRIRDIQSRTGNRSVSRFFGFLRAVFFLLTDVGVVDIDILIHNCARDLTFKSETNGCSTVLLVLEFITSNKWLLIHELDFRRLVTLVVTLNYVTRCILLNYHLFGSAFDVWCKTCYFAAFTLTIVDQLHLTVTTSHDT